MAPIPNFRHTVEIDGTNIAGITLAGATITRGGSNPQNPLPDPASAYLQLITYDAAGDLVTDYPEFTFGEGIPSGFVDTYADRYEGGIPKLTVGRPIAINASTPSGFEDTYTDTYAAGYDSTRFVGTITAVDYTPALIAVTAVTTGEYLSRREIAVAGWPAETETARVARIAQAAGVAITTTGTSTATVAAYKADEAPMPAADALRDVAFACDGVAYVNRTGSLIYLTRTATASPAQALEPGATIVDDLRMTNELGTVINRVTVKYDGGEVTVNRADSQALYGIRAKSVTTILTTANDATAWANRYLDAWAVPVWHMPTVTLNLNLARTEGDPYPANVDAILDLDLDDAVEMPYLLPGSPVESYTSRVLGYTEVLDPYQWSLTYNLNPAGWRR